MLKMVKLYLTPDDIKAKLGEEYKNSAVLFTKSNIGNDNCLEFECFITDADNMSRNERRERLIDQVPSDNDIIMLNAEMLSEISSMTLGESVDYLNNVIASFKLK